MTPLVWLDDVSMTSPALLNDCWPFGVLLSLNDHWQFGILLSLNDHWQFGVLVLLNTCGQFGIRLLLNACWHFGIISLLNTCWQFGIILLLNSNDQVSSFYWTRGSKKCFLTHFSSFSCYFLILVFSQNCYLQRSSCLSPLHGNLISCPVFPYFWHSKVVLCMCPPMFLAQNAWVSQSKTLAGTWY